MALNKHNALNANKTIFYLEQSVWTLAPLLDTSLKIVNANHATKDVISVTEDYRISASHANLNIFSIRINVWISVSPQNTGIKEIVWRVLLHV